MTARTPTRGSISQGTLAPAVGARSSGRHFEYAAGVNTAVIDIGSNTLLLLIVDEHLRRVVDLARFGRLGKGLDASGRLDPATINKSLAISREYRTVMDEHGVGAPHIIATQALREAANAADFVGP